MRRMPKKRATIFYIPDACQAYSMSCGEKSNAFANLHDVTLQRLDVYHRNNGGYVFYDSKHFAPTVDHWNTVPVIYVETEPGKPAEHPQFKDVITRTLPAKFRTVGSVSAAHLTETGEKVLKGPSCSRTRRLRQRPTRANSRSRLASPPRRPRILGCLEQPGSPVR